MSIATWNILEENNKLLERILKVLESLDKTLDGFSRRDYLRNGD